MAERLGPSGRVASLSSLGGYASAVHENDTIGFSRMEPQLQPNTTAFPESDTIGFSRMELQFQPKHDGLP